MSHLILKAQDLLWRIEGGKHQAAHKTPRANLRTWHREEEQHKNTGKALVKSRPNHKMIVFLHCSIFDGFLHYFLHFATK